MEDGGRGAGLDNLILVVVVVVVVPILIFMQYWEEQVLLSSTMVDVFIRLLLKYPSSGVMTCCPK